MNTSLNAPRALHWMLKVGDLAATLAFLCDGLGMQVLRHEEFNQGGAAPGNGADGRPWSKTLVGFGPAASHFALELTYHYGRRHYRLGNDLAWLGLYSPLALARLEKQGYPLHPTAAYTDARAPDGYRFRFFHDAARHPRLNTADPFRAVFLHVSDLPKACAYWTRLGLQIFAKSSTQVTLGFAADQCKVVLQAHAAPIDHAEAAGRLAFATPHPIAKFAAKVCSKIHPPLATLSTPGKAEVDMVILQDPDDYEICFVGAAGFAALAAPQPHADFIAWATRRALGG